MNLPSYDVDELRDDVTVPPRGGSLSEFLGCFETFYPVLQYPEALERVAYEVCEDLTEENVLYAETRFAPVLLTEEGATQEEMVEAALSGIERGNREFPVTVNLILCLYRGHTLEQNRCTLECAQKYSDRRVVAVDLAGDESQHGTINHPELFQRAHEMDLDVTIHAGEAGPASNVQQALDVGADRIGHGIRSIDDREVMDRIEKESVPLEICFTSNLQTETVAEPEQHPIRVFHNREIMVTVNTDDPAVSQTNINKEFQRLVEAFGFTRKDCRQFLLNAVNAAFVDDSRKQILRDRLPFDGPGEDVS